MDKLISTVRLFAPSGTAHELSTEGVRTIITRLKFIGTLEPHKKIDTQTLKIEDNSFWTPFKRFLKGSSRETTLNFFSSTIDRTKEIIKSRLNDKNTSSKLFCYYTVKDLVKCISGLQAMKETYSSDSYTTSEIQVLIDDINNFVTEINPLIQLIIPKEETNSIEKEISEDE